jgi:hypothetical protein
MTKFRYLGTTLTNHTCIHTEIKSRWKSGNACHHLVQNLLSSIVLFKNTKIKIYRSQSLTLREEHKLMVLENMVPKEGIWV